MASICLARRRASGTFTCSLVTHFEEAEDTGRQRERQRILGPVPKRAMSLVIVRNNGVKARNSNPSERDALTFGTEFYLIYIRKRKRKGRLITK